MSSKLLSYNHAVAITKSDSANIYPTTPVGLTDAVYVGGAGIVAAVFEDGSVVNFTAVAGELIPIKIKRVNDANTTATLMVGLRQV